MSYLAAAEDVGTWLLSTAEPDGAGWSWPRRPGVAPDRSPGVGWGSAGPTLFFVEAFRTTGDRRWLEAARRGASWMAAELEASLEAEAGCGLFTGTGGWVVVLHELAEASGDDEARDTAARVLEAIAGRAVHERAGVQWHGLTEILWGTAGIGCLLLRLGGEYLGTRARELAVAGGDWLLEQAEPARRGICWSLGPGYEAENPHDRRRFPNFAHGAAGIAFFLARLGDESGERRFLDAALEATEWIMTTVRTHGDTCAAYHHEPGGSELYTLGWCHGPPGLGWLFRQLELSTGCPEWRSWLRRAARADRESGIPERREPGFWDNVGRCCGSASVAEFFLDLHRLDGRDEDLDFAVLLVDDLLGRATTGEHGMCFSNYEHRNEEPVLPPETTYLQGAAGIGSTLLRLHRHLGGDYWTVPWPHTPSWTPAP